MAENIMSEEGKIKKQTRPVALISRICRQIILGALLGDELRKMEDYVSDGALKVCDCEKLAKAIVGKLKEKGAVTKAQQDKFLDHFKYNKSQIEGGRMGHFVDTILPGGKLITNPTEAPYRAEVIKGALQHAGIPVK